MPLLTDSPFAVLTFLVAPAILTNACTVLALGTSNRLARAADRARALGAHARARREKGLAEPPHARQDFAHAVQRTRMLVRALRRFYFGAGSFAAGACLALLGATAAYFQVPWAMTMGTILTVVTAAVGVGALVLGTLQLVAETRVALLALDEEYRELEGPGPMGRA